MRYKAMILIMAGVWLAGCAHMSLSNDNGTCPPGFPIKGNANSGIYHLPQNKFYVRTRAEFCFDSESAAKVRGYVPAKR